MMNFPTEWENKKMFQTTNQIKIPQNNTAKFVRCVELQRKCGRTVFLGYALFQFLAKLVKQVVINICVYAKWV
jgi:hypothetical protein